MDLFEFKFSPPPTESDSVTSESLSHKLQDVDAASEYLSRSMQDLGKLALDQIRKLEQEKDVAVKAERETMKATLELSKVLRKANEDYVTAEQTHATEMAKMRASTTAKRKRMAETGTSTDILPNYTATRHTAHKKKRKRRRR
eukprot:COSAG05_NODE_443_length_9791_cov_14.720388_7_plen_143_part_00